ncbi:penicillin-binding protein 2 [Silanimonas sp.]|uniref:penicillin-binding protein 2 n=1 Tax=Silanimonas sp. TaxID=1929290 RepID=UPI0022C8266A|nr:penicillin-binding protein 2 [Silanimonas sp.]MCZ8164861.1 penicillin-binding protein 2 [Silanimonas sp.]
MRRWRARPVRNAAAEGEQFRRRALLAAAGVALALLALALGYGRLQIQQHEEYATRSEENRIRLDPIVPARGLVYDRNGVLLADNAPAYRLDIVPERVEDMPQLLAALRERVALSEDELRRFDNARKGTRRFKPIALKLRLSEQEIARLAVDRHRFPGVEVVPYLTRRYPFGELTAHIVGYVGRIDQDDVDAMESRGESRFAALPHIGKTGLERYYESRLRGDVGYQEVETNVENRPLRVLRRHDAKPGADLHLSIDIALQKAMVDAFEGQHGAAIAIDPMSGEILAMVSLPSYDPNLFVGGISFDDYRRLNEDVARPLFNRNVLGGFPPGSTVKPFMALAGLEEGLITPDTTIFSSGTYRLPGHERGYMDWRPGGHGTVNLRESLAQSVNTYYFDLAMKLGIDRISADFDRMGFGRPTGIDLAGEASGVLPSREWKQRRFKQAWYPGETVISGIGQGYWVTTPLQLAQGTAMLAGDGQLRRPHLVRATQAGFGAARVPEPQPPAVPVVDDPAHLAAVRDGLVATMHGPTGTAARAAAGAHYLMAGKTGTAQRVSRRGDERLDPNKLPYHLRHQALFVGYAPAEAPTIALALVVEHGGSGSTAAAPVARRIFDAWIGPPPAAPATLPAEAPAATPAPTPAEPAVLPSATPEPRT